MHGMLDLLGYHIADDRGLGFHALLDIAEALGSYGKRSPTEIGVLELFDWVGEFSFFRFLNAPDEAMDILHKAGDLPGLAKYPLLGDIRIDEIGDFVAFDVSVHKNCPQTLAKYGFGVQH